MLVGHDVVIDGREGNAINFINYISVAFFLFVSFIKLPSIKAKWLELWPFGTLVFIYLINFYTAPFVNGFWISYQVAFILISALIHLLLSGQTINHYEKALNSGGFMIFTAIAVCFLIIVCISMYSQFSVMYILSEFNDSFINSVNDIGLMKQYYGYVVGFLVIYGVLVLNNKGITALILVLSLLTSFGIRSFLIGMAAVLIVSTIKKPFRFLFFILLSLVIGVTYWDQFLVDLVYDTRFYAYMNGWDIIQKFPFGVGLGGYPVYTEIYNNDLFATFFNIDAALNYVPNSPESDIVHLFGSLGLWLGVVHLLIQLRLIILGIVNEKKMLPFEKCMFYYFVFMTAFGISEDTMFTVSYWIFFGITSGVIASVSKRVKHA